MNAYKNVIPNLTASKSRPALLVALSLAVTSPALADDVPQNGSIGAALGSALGAFIKSHHLGAGNQSDTSQNVQDNTSSTNQISVPTTLSTMGDADRQLMAQGMWHDPRTGLVWMRCVLGDSWTGSTCQENKPNGMAKNTWWRNDAVIQISQLNFGGFKDWRLPTIEDLYGLYNVQKCKGSNYHPTGDDVPIPKSGGAGTISVPHNCALGTGATSKIDNVVFPIPYDQNFPYLSASDDHRYPLSTRNASATFSPYRLWTIDFQGDNTIANGKDGTSENDQPLGYVLVVRGGHSTGEYEHLLEQAHSLAAAIQQKTIADAAVIKRNNEVMKQNARAAQERRAAWQSTVKAGDRVHVTINRSYIPGLVIQDNGQLVLLQTVEYGNLWFKRSELQ